MKTTIRIGFGIVGLAIILCLPLVAGIGVKGGLSFSLGSGDSPIFESSGLWGFHLGISYRIPLGAGLSLQPEVNFAMKGATYYSVHTRNEDSARLNYVEIPFLLNVRLLGKIEAFGGPYAAVLVHSTPIDEMNAWTWPSSKVNKADAGIVLGARYLVLKALFIEGRWSQGFVRAVIDADNIKNNHKDRVLSLSVGLQL
jgi:hypothetical protein